MKRFAITAVVLAMSMSMPLAAAAEGFNLGGFTKKIERSAGFNFGADGFAGNFGDARGDKTWAGSKTTKQLFGEGYAKSDLCGCLEAEAVAGVRMATEGYSGAVSKGSKHSRVQTEEIGQVGGSGFTNVWGSETHSGSYSW
jgi:hypothetical protein